VPPGRGRAATIPPLGRLRHPRLVTLGYRSRPAGSWR